MRHAALAALLLLFAAPVAASPTPEVVVQRFLADYQAMRLAAIVAAATPDTVLAMPFAPGGPARVQGPQAIAAYLRDVFGKYRSIVLRDTVLTPAANGRDVMVEAVADFTTPAGATHSVGYIWIITVADGRITASRNYLMPLAPG
jgi:ketosteroid isomerase-like protein